MNTLSEYRRVLRDLIHEYAQYKPSVGDIRTEVIFDEANDHYELSHTGWSGPYRVYGRVLHFDIRDGMVWIAHNGPDDPIATKLVEAGLPRDRFVLADKPPDVRKTLGFASV